MNTSIYQIDIPNLLIAFIPAAIVMLIYAFWSLKTGALFYAIIRMVSQLLLIGLALNYIFNSSNPILVSILLTFMLLVASWIALRPIKEHRIKYYFIALFSIVVGGLFTLSIIVFGVIQLNPWYEPRYLIPLAGMIFSSSMNSVSLAAERFLSEEGKGDSYIESRNIAFKTSLLPIVNTLFAVGLVALPGMMTGQILAGISPFIAVRYQIMVMFMLLGSAGISSALYLSLRKK